MLVTVPTRTLEKATLAFLKHRTRCFWSTPVSWAARSLEDVLFVAEGLEEHGGREGFLLGRELRAELPVADARH